MKIRIGCCYFIGDGLQGVNEGCVLFGFRASVGTVVERKDSVLLRCVSLETREWNQSQGIRLDGISKHGGTWGGKDCLILE